MPTRETPWPAGTPCWVDYGSPDVEASKAFYAALLGWTFEGGQEEYGGYFTCLRDGRAAAGMSPMFDPSVPVRWNTYFATDDVDASCARVSEAGGAVVAPAMDVGPFGRMAIVADGQGNAFGLWQAAAHIGYTIFNEPGSVVWNDLATDDADAARAFYGAVFGFAFTEVEGPQGYTTFATDDRPLGGLGPAAPGDAKGWKTCFSVASADEAVATAEAGGAKIVMAPMDTPYGRFATLVDPWGVTISVMQAP